MKKALQKVIALIVVIISGFFISQNQKVKPNQLTDLFEQKRSGEIVTVKAQVIKKLADDNDGDRHQKMIVRVGNMTVLLAHNIDIAPRVPVKQSEQIEVKGQYEWNEKGGVIHWTHLDARKKHVNGWIKYKDKKYQ